MQYVFVWYFLVRSSTLVAQPLATTLLAFDFERDPNTFRNISLLIYLTVIFICPVQFLKKLVCINADAVIEPGLFSRIHALYSRNLDFFVTKFLWGLLTCQLSRLRYIRLCIARTFKPASFFCR